jgi:hypothetical protein
MEIITIILTVIMGLFSPVGAVTDEVTEQTIRDQLHDAEAIAVRMDNAPSYQLLSGKLDRLRLAGRGLFLLEGVRIDTLDIETDAIDVDITELRQGDVVLDQPLQGVVHLRLTLDDLNDALRSPTVTRSLRDLSLNLLGESTIGGLNRSDVVDASIDVIDSNRLQFNALIREQNTGEELDIVIEFGLSLLNGYQLQIQSPRIIAGEQVFPDDLLSPVVDGFTQSFTLRNLDPQGITIRLLELGIDDEAIHLVAFAHIDPSSPLFD